MVLNSVASAGRSAVAQAISNAIHHFAELRQDSPFAIIAFGNGMFMFMFMCVCVYVGVCARACVCVCVCVCV